MPHEKTLIMSKKEEIIAHEMLIWVYFDRLRGPFINYVGRILRMFDPFPTLLTSILHKLVSYYRTLATLSPLFVNVYYERPKVMIKWIRCDYP